MIGLMRLKALSIKQPWANLIATGEKTIETRLWATSYRGQVLLLSSKQPKIAPAGCAVALAELVDCRPMTKRDETAARCLLYPEAVAWVLSNVKALEPFPMKGQLGLFDVEISEELLKPRLPAKQKSLFDDWE
jgi:hypothetical protein